MKLKVKALREGAKLPTRGTEGAAGLDLYCYGPWPLFTSPRKIPTGIAVEIPAGYVGLIQTRSSSALKGITVFTTVIDADYRGEIFITAKGDEDAVLSLLENGQRIAQLVLLPLPMFEPEWADELSETERGAGGYGSTGV